MGLFDFMAGARPDDPSSYQALQMRQKIALAAMAQQRKGYPKNIGEGLTAIGDALGEKAQMNAMERSQGAFDAYQRAHPPPDPAALLGARPAAAVPGPISDASDVVPPPAQTVEATPEQSPETGPANPVQASQLATLISPAATAAQPASAPVASLDPSVVPPAAANPVVRNAIARAAMNGAGVPQQNPTLGAVPAALSTPQDLLQSGDLGGQQPDQRMALLAPDDARDAVTNIRPAPPVRVAQATGSSPGIPQINRVTPPVTMPPQAEPQLPANEPYNAAEIAGMRRQQQGIHTGNPMMEKEGAELLALGTAKRQQADKDNMARYQQLMDTYRQRATSQEGAERGAPLAQQQLTEAQAKAAAAVAAQKITDKTGLPANVVVDNLEKKLNSAGADVSLLRNARMAKQALEGGVISGMGADFKINMERAKAMFGNLPASELASRSEMLAAATKAMVKYGLNQYQPGDPRVTNSDLITSGSIIGGDPSQQFQTRKELVNMVLQDANKRIGEYERYHDWAVGGLAPEEGYRLRTDPIHADPKVVEAATSILLKPENIKDPYVRQKFDERFGAGSAELEIARAERRARKGR